MFFPASSTTQLKGFSDADWATCSDTRRSVTGFCVFLGDSLVAWKSKKQNIVSRSSVEAEYRALATTTSELIWLQQLLSDFQITQSSPTVLFCDNQAAVYIATNPVFHERTKHIEIDLYFVRSHVQRGEVKLLPVRTQHQLADMFTKPLPAPALKSITSKLSLKDLYSTA